MHATSSVAVLVLLIAIPLAGCIAEEPTPAQAPSTTPAATPPPANATFEPQPVEFAVGPVANVTIRAGLDYVIRPATLGWGMLRLNAEADADLVVDLTHETIDDLELFSQEGEGIYDERAFTGVYLTADPEEPYDAYYFEWWGTPDWAVWPHGSQTFDGPDGVDVDAGDTAYLFVATTVPGYQVTLRTAGTDAPNETYHWRLTSHPNFQIHAPDPRGDDIATTTGARVGDERHWLADGRIDGAGILKARDWTYLRSTTVRAGAESGDLGWDGTGDCATGDSLLGDIPFPSYAVVTGYSYSSTTLIGLRDGPCDITFFRHLNQTYAGVEEEEEGAAFLTVPLTPP